MTSDCFSGRSAVHEAIGMLNSAGYVAERVIGTPKLFDIVAWRGGQTICVVIRSSRRGRMSSFSDMVRSLSKMVRSGAAPGIVQFWIYRCPGWAMWRIAPHGAVPVISWKEDLEEEEKKGEPEGVEE